MGNENIEHEEATAAVDIKALNKHLRPSKIYVTYHQIRLYYLNNLNEYAGWEDVVLGRE